MIFSRALLGRCCINGVLLLTGCAAQPAQRPPLAEGHASWQPVQPAGMRRYSLALGEVASGGVIAADRTRPAYPVQMLATCPPPVEVSAQLIVNRRGTVDAVRVTDPQNADPHRLPFVAAVRAAAMRWTYAPLVVTHWSADAEGNSHVVDTRTLPFSMHYRFRFTCHNGKAGVSTDAIPAVTGAD